MRFLGFVFAVLMAVSMPAIAVEMGDDGLHKPTWLEDTFKDVREDLATANAQGKRLLIIWEQRGCIYCNKMHNEIFPQPEIDKLLREKFYVVQMNLFGDLEVTDLDGTVLPEREMAGRWGIIFTPTMMFMRDGETDEDLASEFAAATMPGAFGKYTTRHLMEWILQKGYDGDEPFQKYHARMLKEEGIIE
ncbi:thioredoxin family protein [Profundibacter amoris]|uniref:Thioredoxin n=1 Tax=Profundibacter amoris TaxID=2171755 RepID=A0A347UDT4_9RHOB|nr:thioredoxin family protein [Profundibacter amoris]AXX97012.1 thioredoxin [Profundibacter amoris]